MNSRVIPWLERCTHKGSFIGLGVSYENEMALSFDVMVSAVEYDLMKSFVHFLQARRRLRTPWKALRSQGSRHETEMGEKH